LAIRFSILVKEAPAFVGVHNDEFCTCLIAQLLTYEVDDVKLGERSIHELLEVPLSAVRRYAIDEDLHCENALKLC
jgi:hypothetical protein